MIIYVVMFASMILQLAAFMLIVFIRDRKKLYGDPGLQGPRGADGHVGKLGDTPNSSEMNFIRGDRGVRGRKGERGFALWDTQEHNHYHTGTHTDSAHTHPGRDNNYEHT